MELIHELRPVRLLQCLLPLGLLVLACCEKLLCLLGVPCEAVGRPCQAEEDLVFLAQGFDVVACC